MTKKNDKKQHIRREMARTGKSYTTVLGEVGGNASRPPASRPFDGLRLWRQCVQAVGWNPFTKSDEDLFEYFPDVEKYANDEIQGLLEGEDVSKEVREAVLALGSQAAVAAGRLDAGECLANLERADLLLVQSGWKPEIVRFGLEHLRSDYDVDVNDRLRDGPITVDLRSDHEQRVLVLATECTYRVRGARPAVPAAGRLCRMRLFDHYVPAEVVVEYLDDQRFGVFSLEELEACEVTLN